MIESRVARWSPLGGIAFVALWLVAFGEFLVEELGTTDAEVIAHYTDPGNQGRAQMSSFLIVLAGLFFLWFLTGLRARLADVEGRAGVHATLVFGAGLVSSMLWLTASAFWMGVGYTAQETEAFTVDPDTARLVAEMGYLMWVLGTVVALLIVLATSLSGLRTRLVPSWLAWLGMPVAAVMLLSALFIGFLVFLAWLLVVSVLLLLRGMRPAQLVGAPAREGVLR